MYRVIFSFLFVLFIGGVARAQPCAPAPGCPSPTYQDLTVLGTVTLSAQVANSVYAGPLSGGSATPAFRALTGADLPSPSSFALGGIESLAPTSHLWINSISTSGVPAASQPACGDLSNGAASCSTDATNASNISSGALPNARLSANLQSVAAASNSTYASLVQTVLGTYEWVAGSVTDASITALRANTLPWPAIHVQGFYSPSYPGGGGDFEYNPADMTTTDNGCTIFVDAASHRYYRQFSGALDVRYCGAKQDGATNDAVSINKAITVAAAIPTSIQIRNTGSNVVVGSAIVPVTNTTINCSGYPVIYLANGSNSAVIESSMFESLIGSPNSEPADDFVTITGCIVDGNVTGQTSGTPGFQTGISIHGAKPTLDDLMVRNVYGPGVRLNGGIVEGAPRGSEPEVTRVQMYNIGRSGLYVQGPSDGYYADIIVVNASQAADNTYYGIDMEANGNGRLFDFHGWHTSTATNRVAYQGYFNAEGVQVSNSHFEGGRKQLALVGGLDTFTGIDVYSNFGTVGNELITISSSGNQIIGSQIHDDPGTGINAATGVAFSNYASGNILKGNYYTNLATYGPFSFPADGGLNIIDDQGFMSSGGSTTFFASASNTDTIDYDQGGTVLHAHNRYNVASGFLAGNQPIVLGYGGFGLQVTSLPSAPGTWAAGLYAVCGTNSGTLKLIVVGGTSSTPVTLLDNVGSGVHGC